MQRFVCKDVCFGGIILFLGGIRYEKSNIHGHVHLCFMVRRVSRVSRADSSDENRLHRSSW